MITSPKVVLKTRSWSPLAARAWTILNSWRWNSRFASGFTASVRPAVTPVMTRATASTGRNRRNALTPAAERDDLEIAGQATASQEDRDQERHGQGVGEEGREHVDEEL